MNHLTKVLAIILTVTLIAPAPILLASQQAQAAATSVIETGPNLKTNIKTTFESTFTALKSALIEIHTFTTKLATEALWINQYVLQPLAFVMSGNLLKMMTASILAFVAGGINGTGAPQFVQNLQGHMQTIGDIKANAFLALFIRNSNSPFATAISSSMRDFYLQQTSLSGFFAANRNTLPYNWSQGGLGVWFALTTQDQNNPYLFYQTSQSRLSTVVTSAIAAREQMLAWGQGMLSWCGEGSSKQTVNTSSIPKVACIDEDGTETPIKTPASVINSELQGALGSTRAKLQQLGQLGKEVGGILGDISMVMGTVGFAQQILGGSSDGLSGFGTSAVTYYRDDPGYLGVTPSDVYQTASTLPSAGADKLSIISQYESAWNAIQATAVAASTTVTQLATVCTANATSASSAQAAAARVALSGPIASVLAQANTASTTVASARAMVAKVQSQLNSGDQTLQNAGMANMETLRTMPPTASDLGRVQQDAKSFDLYGTTASPEGSLTVTGGSLVDQMSLIATNAQTLLSVCAPATSDVNYSGF